MVNGYIITKKDLKIVRTIQYNGIQNGELQISHLDRTYDELHIAVDVNGSLIDLRSCQKIEYLVFEDGYISSPIFENTLYALEIKQVPEVTDAELQAAADSYERYLEIQEEEKHSDKILKFPQRRLV